MRDIRHSKSVEWIRIRLPIQKCGDCAAKFLILPIEKNFQYILYVNRQTRVN